MICPFQSVFECPKTGWKPPILLRQNRTEMQQRRAKARRRYLAGIDEAGRGPLAGPVTAACVCLPANFKSDEITDSKKLLPKKRAELFDVVCKSALAWSVVSVGPRRIESLNILQATKLAMRLCAERVRVQIKRLDGRAEPHFLVDGNAALETTLSHETIIKGDATVLAISAASIIAKVTRDRLMERLETRYPGYGFDVHKGYGTKFHCEKIRELGPSRVHRSTFSGVSDLLAVIEANAALSEAGIEDVDLEDEELDVDLDVQLEDV